MKGVNACISLNRPGIFSSEGVKAIYPIAVSLSTLLGRTRVCVRVYVVCVCVCVYVCVCAHACVCTCVCVCAYACMLHVCVCGYVCVCTCMCMHACMCVCLCMHMYVCTCVCVHMCMCKIDEVKYSIIVYMSSVLTLNCSGLFSSEGVKDAETMY